MTTTDPKPLTAEQLAELREAIVRYETVDLYRSTACGCLLDSLMRNHCHALLAAAEAVQTEERDAEIELLAACEAAKQILETLGAEHVIAYSMLCDAIDKARALNPTPVNPGPTCPYCGSSRVALDLSMVGGAYTACRACHRRGKILVSTTPQEPTECRTWTS